MAIQYPHYLFIPSGGNTGTQDANGDWVQPSGPAMYLLGRCREEVDGKGTEIQTAGGTFYKASSLVQLPKSIAKVAAGTEVVITNDAAGLDIRAKGPVLKFKAWQFHSQLWI